MSQFFDRQDAARSNTAWLVFLFIIAVVGLVGGATAAGYYAGTLLDGQVQLSQNGYPGRDAPQGAEVNPWVVAGLFGTGTLAVIVLGSLYQVAMLRSGGGTRVAEMLGGRPLSHDTNDLAERRLLNVVEEMAIASGTPVPPVYLMDESAINAFAAGDLPGNAVIGVTRGAVQRLSRDQLQGVIAHEFSHILNGDMRMNIRMIGILHGILLLSLIGHVLLRLCFFSSGGRSSNSGRGRGGAVMAMLVASIVLIVLGSIGSFIGGLIKAAVSRQREYLADASAVQFTRNPAGIGGALKRIAAMSQHGRLNHPNAGIASHMYFAQGVFEGLTGMMATHPPLRKRIRAIEPNWDGTLPQVSRPRSEPETPDPRRSPLDAATAGLAPAMAAGLTAAAATGASDGPPARHQAAITSHLGQPQQEHRDYVGQLLTEIDRELIDAAHEAYSSRALVFALLIDSDADVRTAQLAALDQMISADVVDLTRRLLPKVAQLPDAARLPLVDIALPMLRMMTSSQYATFAKALAELIRADNRLTVFEWTLSQVLIRHLKEQYQPTPPPVIQFYRLNRFSRQISVLLSILARIGSEPDQQQAALQAGAAKLANTRVTLLPQADCSFRALEAAVKRLQHVSPRRRGDLLEACAATVCADGVITVKEAELLRGIADLLECPMPPLVGEVSP